MKPNSATRQLSRAASGFVILALLAGCSGGGSTDTVGQVAEQTRSLGVTLSNAIDMANDASIGFADEASRAGAITAADAAVLRLAETARGVSDPNLRLLAQDVVNVANRVVGELRRGDIPAAARLRVDQFVPLASQLTAMRPQSEGAASDRSQSRSPDLIVPGTLAVLVVLGVGVFLTRRARHGLEAERQPDRESRRPRTASRAWNEPHPLYPHDAVENAPSTDKETRRSTKMRTVHFDLKTLLQTTVEQLREDRWEVTVVCPSVQLSGDPIRLQRALIAAVGAAKLRGADRVGLAVEIVKGGVLLTIGDDASVEPEEAADFADRLASQVGVALGLEDVGMSWMSDDEVTLFTVSISPNVQVPAKATEQARTSTEAALPDRDAGEGVTRADEQERQAQIGIGRT